MFGMELLTRLDLASTNEFFSTFFRLPDTYWRGFLASRLSSLQVGRCTLLCNSRKASALLSWPC